MKRISKLWKLYLFYTAVLLVIMTVAGLVLQGQLKKTLEDHQAADVLLLNRVLEAHLPKTTDPKVLGPLCHDFQSSTGVRATIIRQDGVVIGESDPAAVEITNHLERPEVQGALKGGVGTAIRRSKTLGMEMLYVAVWVRDRELVLRLAIPTTKVKGIENHVMMFLAFSLYLTPLLGMLIAYLFARYISAEMR